MASAAWMSSVTAPATRLEKAASWCLSSGVGFWRIYVWTTRQTCKEDGSHCDRKPTLAGGCRAGPPGLKLQLCPWATSETSGKHLRLTGLQFPHVRNELGSRGSPKVFLTYFPEIIREIKFLVVLLFVPKTNLHTRKLPKVKECSEWTQKPRATGHLVLVTKQIWGQKTRVGLRWDLGGKNPQEEGCS